MTRTSEPVGGTSDRESLVGLDSYWKDQQIEYSSGLPVYVGRHYRSGRPDGDENWAVWKFTYSGVDVTRLEGPIVGTWTDRATLGWA